MHKFLDAELIEKLASNSSYILLKRVGVTTFSFRLDKIAIFCKIELILLCSKLCKTCVRDVIKA